MHAEEFLGMHPLAGTDASCTQLACSTGPSDLHFTIVFLKINARDKQTHLLPLLSLLTVTS